MAEGHATIRKIVSSWPRRRIGDLVSGVNPSEAGYPTLPRGQGDNPVGGTSLTDTNGQRPRDRLMRLDLAEYPVTALEAGDQTTWDNGRLTVNTTELESMLLERDARLARMRVRLACPGAAVRIIHILDVIEPRVKAEGPGCVFPGQLGPGTTVGSGRTHRLAGCAVMTAGELLTDDEGMKVREAIVDMSGPGQSYSPFGSTCNVVLEGALADGVTLEEGEEAYRLAGLRAAAGLAEATLGSEPAEVRRFETAPPERPLPRAAYICQLMTVGTTQNAWTYGYSMLRSLPTVLHPNELIDGALVSANFHFATIRTPTYMHQNNPVVRELYRHHATELDFVGVILAPGYDLGNANKERTASFGAKLALMLGADGVIITQEGGGHGGVDVMMLCQQAARLGMRPVVVVNEMADVSGADPGLVYAVPEADAIVSTGNREELIELPRMPTVLGGSELLDGEGPAEGPLRLPIRQLYTSTSQVGAMRLAAAAY